jgi:hypothetical protein
MRTTSFALAWVFVFVVSAYDMHFAWQYRDGFQLWEMNPAARILAGLFGLWFVFAFKACLLGFAALVGVYCYRNQHRLTAPYTALVSTIHLGLSCHYAVGLLV